ncbi:Hsp70 family protein [Stackebrandtia soli]|uniref:Hsp70 family protein n=1 Tax=Stackebrandtia soli TaxID=1892856 RepID=UPI0039E7E81C
MSAPPGYILGVDLGTSHTVAVIRWPDGRSRPLLVDGAPVMPSAVFVDEAGHTHVGRDAQRLAQIDPSRFEPNPKHRIGEGSILLGDRDVPAVALLAAVLRNVAAKAVESVGQLPPAVLTYPAKWGATRRNILQDAAAQAGFPPVKMVPEPVAAAHYFAEVMRQPIPVGASVAVFDFGGGTLDIAVVRHESENEFVVLADGGLDDLGGLDVDEVLLNHLGQTIDAHAPQIWKQLTNPQSPTERRNRRLFWDDVRGAKEMLSRTTVAPVPVPSVDTALHLTRDELERLASPLLERAIEETRRVIAASGQEPDALAGLFLVGGASRMPLVARLLHTRLGIAPTVLEQPELPVAEGSLAAVGGMRSDSTGEQPSAVTPPPGIAPVVTPPSEAAAPVTGPPSPVSGPPESAYPVSGAATPQYSTGTGQVSSPPDPGYPVSGAPTPQYPIGSGQVSGPPYQSSPPQEFASVASVSGPPRSPHATADGTGRYASVSSGRSDSFGRDDSDEDASWYRKRSNWIGAAVILVVLVLGIGWLVYDPYPQRDMTPLAQVGEDVPFPENASILGPGTIGDRAFFAADDGTNLTVTAIDMATGSALWETDPMERTRASWDIFHSAFEMVLIGELGTDDIALTILDWETGEQTGELTIGGTDSVDIIGELLVVSSPDDDKVTAYDATGEQQWTLSIADMEWIGAAVPWDYFVADLGAFDDADSIFFYAKDSEGTVSVIDLDRGEVSATKKVLTETSQMTAFDGKLYVTDGADGYTVTVYDMANELADLGTVRAASTGVVPRELGVCGETRVCVFEDRTVDSDTMTGFSVIDTGGENPEVAWSSPEDESLGWAEPVGDRLAVNYADDTDTTFTQLYDEDFEKIGSAEEGRFNRIDSGSMLRFPWSGDTELSAGPVAFVGLGADDGSVYQLGSQEVIPQCAATATYLTCPVETGYRTWKFRE